MATEQKQKVKNNCLGCGTRPTFHEKTKKQKATQIRLGGQPRTTRRLSSREHHRSERSLEQTGTARLSPGQKCVLPSGLMFPTADLNVRVSVLP